MLVGKRHDGEDSTPPSNSASSGGPGNGSARHGRQRRASREGDFDGVSDMVVDCTPGQCPSGQLSLPPPSAENSGMPFDPRRSFIIEIVSIAVIILSVIGLACVVLSIWVEGGGISDLPPVLFTLAPHRLAHCTSGQCTPGQLSLTALPGFYGGAGYPESLPGTQQLLTKKRPRSCSPVTGAVLVESLTNANSDGPWIDQDITHAADAHLARRVIFSG